MNYRSWLVFPFCILLVFCVVKLTNVHFGIYGISMSIFLGLKLLLSGRKIKVSELSHKLTTAVVVPVYNEDPKLFKDCLNSLLNQTHKFDEIYVVDDGSTNLECWFIAACCFDVKLRRQIDNQGKRHALAWAFRQSQADIFVTVDSDTILHPEALAKALNHFENPKVQAVTGQVRALNAKTNILTRLEAMRYINAFLWERAAYSSLGSVLCCCGSFALYRRDIVMDNLHDFVNQKFLGVPVQYGDDRRMTNYALQRGRVELAAGSIAYTAVPEKLSHFIRQQNRWNKSFFRETLWSIRNLSFKTVGPWLAAIEFLVWIIGSLALLTIVIFKPVATGEVAVLTWIAYASAMAWVRSIRAIDVDQSGVPLWVFLVAPVYGMLHAFLLLPLRIFSLFTLRRGKWGTRKSVEVKV